MASAFSLVAVGLATTQSSRAIAATLIAPPKTSKKKKKHGNGGSLKSVSLRCFAQIPADIPPAISAAYGAILLGGGAFAYARSGSKGSIIGGISGAALMATTYYFLQSPETKEIGNAIGFGSAFLFTSVFAIRLSATRKLIPSGPLLLLSLGSLGVFYLAYFQDKV